MIRDLRKTSAFIDGELDDYGLTTQEFRVYCHMARRAGNKTAWPGIDSIAKVCCISKTTAIKVIRLLESMQMIEVDRRTGANSIYTMVDKSSWEAKERLEFHRATIPDEVTHHTNPGNATIPNEGTVVTIPDEVTHHTNPGNATIPNEGTKVPPISTPIEVHPVPESLNTPEFCEAWDSWKKYKKERREKLTPTTIQRNFKKFENMGIERAVAMINHTMDHGWQGLFEDKSANGNSPAKHQNREVDHASTRF